MGSEATHIRQANRNQAVLEQLITDLDPSSDWIAVVAFYKALHIVEAVFSCQETHPNNHSRNHKTRNNKLKNKYDQIYYPYYNLYKNSKVARYLEIGPEDNIESYLSFNHFMTNDELMKDALAIDLITVETESVKLLSGIYVLSLYTGIVTHPASTSSTRFASVPSKKSSD